jgi:mannose-6-phosphate isomerase-like protein (cupin superfamily)
MNHMFKINTPFRVPDGTLVSPFLNSKDNQSGLPFNLVDGFSIAAGIVDPQSQSKIHIMPFVTQVTFVRRGTLKVKMKAPEDNQPYEITVSSDAAVLTKPGTLFQLINEKFESCATLYVVSPAYLFEMSSGKVIYDDAHVFEEENWEQLAKSNWQLKGLPSINDRKETERRLGKYTN